MAFLEGVIGCHTTVYIIHPLRCKMDMFQKSHSPTLWDRVQNLYRKLAHYHRSQEGRIWKPPPTRQNFLCSVFVSWLLTLLKWLVKFEAVSDFVRLTWRLIQEIPVRMQNLFGNIGRVLSSVELLSWCMWLWNLLSRVFAHRWSYTEIVKLINEIKGEAQEGEGEREVEYSSWMSELSLA